MKHAWAIILIVLFASCKDKQSSSISNVESGMQSQDISSKSENFKLEVYDFNGFKSFLKKDNDTVCH